MLFDPARVIDEAWKARMVKRSLALCAAMKVKRCYWYTYDNPDMSMSSVMKEAWQEMRGMLIATPSRTATSCRTCGCAPRSIVLSTPVPEMSSTTMLLAGLGLGGLVAWLRCGAA